MLVNYVNAQVKKPSDGGSVSLKVSLNSYKTTWHHNPEERIHCMN